MANESGDGKGGGPKKGLGKGTIIGMPLKQMPARRNTATETPSVRVPAGPAPLKPLLRRTAEFTENPAPEAQSPSGSRAQPSPPPTAAKAPPKPGGLPRRTVMGTGATSQELRAIREVTPKLELDPRSEDSIMRKNPLERADNALASALDEALGGGAARGLAAGTPANTEASVPNIEDFLVSATADEEEATTAAPALSEALKANTRRSVPAPASEKGHGVGSAATAEAPVAAKRTGNPLVLGVVAGMGFTSVLVLAIFGGYHWGKSQGAPPTVETPGLTPRPAARAMKAPPAPAAKAEQPVAAAEPSATGVTPSPAPAVAAPAAPAVAPAAAAPTTTPPTSTPTAATPPIATPATATAAPTPAAPDAPSAAKVEAPATAAPAVPAATAPPTVAAATPATVAKPASVAAAPAATDPPAPATTAELPAASAAIKAMAEDARDAEAKKLRSKAAKSTRAGNAVEAEALLREALAYDPGGASIAQDLAESLLAQKRAADAYPWAKRATSLAPRAAGPYVTLGDAEAAVGRPAAATEAWRRALALDAGNAQAKARLSH